MTERDPLVLIQESLTDAEVRQFLDEAARRWPRTDGAHVADVLELTTSHDMFLDQTEPFFDVFGDLLPTGTPNTAVLHLLIILGRELTVANLTAVLTRAGLVPASVPRLHWRVATAPSGAQSARTAIGWQAQGREFFYLTGAKAGGAEGYFLCRWRIGGASFLDDLTEACRTLAAVDSDIHGRQLAELFEAGESLPEIGWFPGARPGSGMHVFLHADTAERAPDLIQHGTVTGRLPRTQADTDADEFREEILRARREEGT
jgi:hypothetical protein